MHNHVLQTRASNEAHRGKNLASLLRNVCCEWKIEEKSPALVTNNARNMILAGAGAKIEPCVRCIAHTLNLSSQKALKVDTVSALLVKIGKHITLFHRSTCEALKEMQSQLHLINHKLVHNV